MTVPLPNPVRRILDQSEIGFSLGRKIKLSLIGIAYLLSPIDVISDPLLPFGVVDDGVVLFLLVKVWLSRTIAPDSLKDCEDIVDTPPADAVPVRNTSREATQ